MSRRIEISMAFKQAVRIEPSGRRTLSTRDFVKELERYNCQWSLKQANEWIETYTHNFRDISTEEGEARTFYLFNSNGGL